MTDGKVSLHAYFRSALTFAGKLPLHLAWWLAEIVRGANHKRLPGTVRSWHERCSTPPFPAPLCVLVSLPRLLVAQASQRLDAKRGGAPRLLPRVSGMAGNIMEYNGGAVVAMTGKDCVGIATCVAGTPPRGCSGVAN